MKSLKHKLFEYRQNLNFEQSEIDTIVNEHINLCNDYSEREIYANLCLKLERFKYYDSVKEILESIDTELSSDPLLFSLKDLYAKINRKGDSFLYENSLNTILEIITESNDDVRKNKIFEDLKLYEWIPEIRNFLLEMMELPQEKLNYTSAGGKIENVYSVVLQLKEGYLTYVEDKWFLMNDEGVTATLLENHIKDTDVLKKYRLLEQAINYAEFNDDKITFELSEELSVTFDTTTKKVLLNGEEKEEETTLESLFNSPLVPYAGKGFYPVLNETFINLDKFMEIDTVKRIYNIAKPQYECYVFKYNNHITQYRIDKRQGNSIYTYESASIIVESVMQELGVDMTFFFEDLLSTELKKLNNIEKQEKVLLEKLNNIDNSIIKIKDEKELLNENNTLKRLLNNLLSDKHKISEQIKVLKNEKVKLLS